MSHPMLFMLWPTAEHPRPIEPQTAAGYEIRAFRPGDQQPFLELMALVDFDPFDEAKLAANAARIIPGGWFFAVHQASGRIAATAMALHNYTGDTPFGGDVGWVACHPEHAGRGLGYALTAHVTNRFRAAGYERIQLGTERHRLPAIKTYLKLGYRPVLYRPDMTEIWRDLCQELGWPFEPERWFAGFPPSLLEAEI